MPRGVQFAAAAVAAIGASLAIGTSGALAYQKGTIGYDISFPQCTTTYPTSTGSARTSLPPAAPGAPPRGGSTLRGPIAVPQSTVRSGTRVVAPSLGSLPRGFGIVGVDSGNPFISSFHPGNPCLADEYAHTPNPALYVNTGYDPSYTDTNHTTADCATKSAGVSGNSAQKAAWAVGCSEAQKDLAYVTAQGITNRGGWWLDVETGNSWCGQHGVTCDQSLNQFSIQGLIDTLVSNFASPIGIYSNKTQWTLIVGTNTVHGQAADWYASGQTTALAAAPYCASTNSFTGDPVRLVQFVSASIDRDYACYQIV